ncbi:MAG TPA: cytochrome P450 [Nocardioides sp.]|uniref:cytochrome P450 n=1 Tax=uncultured Nocardioides sp. TaxID=198441 RepID=UPI000EC7B98A|nr:cytochrome P450 [uncultured Nocardioides sp.]HCB05136.1 cytochrome P450 [Nocardioides sp.]HRI94438.1 cytochrome P450 [Nocardioides sp.]HRK44410.1 cytochrome P450 [Nocardioides sp.]
MTTASLSDEVKVEDWQFYDVRSAPVLRWLRQTEPVFHYKPLDFWILNKYDDVRFASRTPELFSVEQGVLINDARFGRNVALDFFDPDGELVSVQDPPRHGEIRRAIAPAFTPNAIGALEDSLRAKTRELFDAVPRGQAFDFVHSFARIIPTIVVCQLVGVPPEEIDVEQIIFWGDEMPKVGAALSQEELAEAASNLDDLKVFLLDLFDRRRANPGVDLMSILGRAQLDGKAVTRANVLTLAELTLLAGIDTTRNTMSATMWSLAQHPSQLAKLVADPSLVKGTIEEVLRWVTPVPGFMRNAKQDIEMRGRTIKKGQYVFLHYFAANRDEDYWSDPDTFDITRATETGVLSFGYGQHACIGAALARLEVRVMLETFLARFSSVELAGTPKRVESPLQHGWHSLPLIMR